MSAAPPLRILLVEDDPEDYEHTRDVLAEIRHGREVVLDWKSSYDTGREAVRANAYDVCLLDHYLGADDGLTFLDEALRAGVTTPFVLLTGRADRTIEHAALASGACDYLAKNEVAPATLERALRHAVERGRMLAALRASEGRFRAVFEHSREAILLADDDARYIDGNLAALELLGVTRERLRELTVMDVSVEDARAAWHAFLTRGTLEGEHALQRPGGETRLAEFRAVAAVTPGVHLSVLRDVTERRRAEDAMREAQRHLAASERRFRVMIEKGQDGISLLDRDLRNIYQSPAAEVISGYSADEARLVTWDKFIDEDQRPRLERAIGELQAGPGATTEVEFALRRRDGALRTVELRARNLLDDPDVGAIVTNFRDITDRKIAERQRDDFFELSLDLFCIAGVDGQFRKVNPAWQHMLGWSPDELTARPFMDFVHPDDRAATERETARLALGHRTISFENRYRTRDGGYRRLRWTANAAIAEGLIYATAHDVTAERAAAERDRLLFARSPIAKWLVDAVTFRVIDINDAALALLGYGRDELLALDVRSLIVEGGRGLAATTRRLRAKTGAVRDVEVTAQGLELESGPAILEVFRDVTELNRAQAELRDSERRYRQIVEHTSEGVWTYDAHGVTRFMNSQMARMLGTTVEAAVGQPIFTFMDPAEIVHAHERLERRARGISERREFKLRRVDGSQLWVSSHADPLHDADGRFEGAVALVTDVTEFRKAEQLRRRIAAIVESSRDAIISCDAGGSIQSWNPAAERLFLYPVGEAMGAPVSMLFLEDAAMLGASERDATLRRRDGSPVEVSVSSSPLGDEQDELVGTSLIVRDISERLKAEAALRRTEDQLRQAQKMEAIGSLAGGVAHDFNNLLTVILSYTTMILDDLQAADPLRTDLEEVQRAGLRATELTRQLLAFSRKQIIEPRILDLNDVVRGVQRMLGRVLGEHIELALVISPDTVMVNADAGQLEQVIMNLVVNARDAMPDGGSLTIETSAVALDGDYAEAHVGVAPGRYAMFAISDTGIGMDRATQARIFEPFFTTKDQSKGTGLGLSTVYGIVQQCGGHIWVYSEPGRGTTFKVYLPRTSRSTPTMSPVTAFVETPPLRGTETVLLVEDEPQVRHLIRNLLVKHGYHVLDAANGGEALLMCEQFPARIHLMLTDVVMPRMNGRALAERLSGQRRDMKVLFMSGYTENTITHHGVLDAGVEFLAKPITPDALLRKLRSVLDADRAP